MNIKRFIEKYHSKAIKDDGCYVSEEFKQFAKDFKSMLKTECKNFNISVTSFTVGHYDVSCFVERQGKYIYISYDVPRGSLLNLHRSDVLYRSAKDDKDYLGGLNNYAEMGSLVYWVDYLFKHSDF